MALSFASSRHSGLWTLLGFGWSSSRSGQNRLILSSDIIVPVGTARLGATHWHDMVITSGNVLVQETNDVVVKSLLSHIAWKSVHVIWNISVGMVIQHGTNGFKGAFPSSQKQWGLVLISNKLLV
jgi:hypothetical protein